MFQYAFPVDKADLDQLVYLHDFTLDPALGEPVDTTEVEAAVQTWRRANQSGASLALTELPDGDSVIIDHRNVEETPARQSLSPAETALYCYLDAGVAEKLLTENFQREHRASFEALGGETGVARLVARWLGDALAIRIDGKILALAVHANRMALRHEPPSAVPGEAPKTGLVTETAVLM
jgi:hypothetical protein